MRITVDSNEARSGLADLLRASWDDVQVRRLPAGDILLGTRVGVERKTADDFVASLADGRLFRQCRRLCALVDRPVLLLEGRPSPETIDAGAFRGAILAITVGFRMPVLATRDLDDTARTLRHMAAQESRRRAARRRTARRVGVGSHGRPEGRRPVSRELVDMLAAIPGVGPGRARLLAERFGSVAGLAAAGIRPLMEVSGIGPITAARILDSLHGRIPESGGPESG